jgi:hypothetical protein
MYNFLHGWVSVILDSAKKFIERNFLKSFAFIEKNRTFASIGKK